MNELTPIAVAMRAEELKVVFVGLMLALPAMLDPAMPLVSVMERYGQTAYSPIVINRLDGTTHSTETVGVWLQRVSELRGEILAKDLLSLAMIHGATRIGDMIDNGGLQDPNVPLLEFARHFRNACAHGDRWHFLREEPRNRAALRGRELSSSLHGTRATFVWVAPGDYLDFLDDIAVEMSSSG